MKFQQNLEAHITPEWRTQYIEYAQLKAMILDAIAQAPPPGSIQHSDYIINFKHKLFEICDKELEKVNMFYEAKLIEITRKYTNLKDELKLAKELTGSSVLARSSFIVKKPFFRPTIDMTKILTRSASHDFKAAFSELYLNVILLRNYQILNHTGFRKVLKKYDKRFRGRAGHDYFVSKVENALFHTNRETKELLRKIEDVMTFNLEHGDRHKAMQKLRVPPLADQTHPWTSFRTGFSLGALIILVIMVILS
ncbi:PREDICTED: xenotropic and polytropic retrovirus receptor 1-like, partial [Rhagoletis zephyria]|uniref:xenotropic and polytropic retrovirus receptor 1-like n=1 Tax=Rhagoletis zephyria TaxID=28612 RepID=UPI0008114A6F